MTLVGKSRLDRKLGNRPFGRDELVTDEIEPTLTHEVTDCLTVLAAKDTRQMHRMHAGLRRQRA